VLDRAILAHLDAARLDYCMIGGIALAARAAWQRVVADLPH
jgi:hypothetical protein